MSHFFYVLNVTDFVVVNIKVSARKTKVTRIVITVFYGFNLF